MFYPEEIVEEVTVRNDIIEIISSHVRLQKKGNSYMGLCPFHNEKTASFSVSPNKQLYHCFGCGAGGNVFTFVMEYENYSFNEAIKYLADRAGVKLPEREYTEGERRKINQRERLFEVNTEAAKYFFYQLRSQRGKYAHEYLKKRGLDDDIINSFGIGFSNQVSNDLYRYLKDKGYEDDFLKITGLINYNEVKESYDKFWNRIIFPIQDSNNRVIGFGGRVMGDAMPKYLNSPETLIFDKSRNLYGIHIAKKSRENYMIICEGYLDVMALNQAGFTNAVASLGTAFTEQQATLLKRYVKEAYLVYDSDNAGIKATLRAINILKQTGIAIKVVDLKPYNDPDDFIQALGKDEFKIRIEEAKTAFFFEVDVLATDHDMSDPGGKTKFFNELAKKLLQFNDELERTIYIEAIAKQYNVDILQLKRLVNKKGSEITPIKKVYPNTNSKNIKNKAEISIDRSQQLLLTWLIDKEELYEVVAKIIKPTDFIEGIYTEVASYVFNQYELGNKVIPAKIINQFESMEEQSQVASLFTADLQVEMNEVEFEKALRDTIIRIKNYSLDIQSVKATETNDVELLQKTINEKVKLNKINIKLI
ncbi:MAG TPA: DNA primase [Clostridiales bacterium]|nr:DNA primase [Clostridiales bacterium]